MNRKYTGSFLLAFTAVFALLVLAGCKELSNLASRKTPEVKSDAESVNTLEEAKNALAEIQQKAEDDKAKAVEAQKALDRAKDALKGDSSNSAKKAAVKAAEKVREEAYIEANASAFALILLQATFAGHATPAKTEKVEEQEKIAGDGTPLEEAEVKEMHIVTFNTGSGASAISPKSVENGKKLNKPEDPERSGYSFEAWFREASLTNEFNFTTDTITQAITLHAKWVQVHDVTFDVDDGNPEIDTQTVEHNQKATRPENPVKAGYTFAGWFDKNGEIDDPKFDFDTLITAPLELEADWNKKEYTVQFVDENGMQLVDTDGNALTAEVLHGEAVTEPIQPSKTGHTFDGWYTAQDGGQKFVFTTVITQNITLYARWIANR